MNDPVTPRGKPRPSERPAEATDASTSGVHPAIFDGVLDGGALPEGATLHAGRFVILTRLGRGGMGVVYKAYDHGQQVTVALKTLDRVTPDAYNRLKDEFRSLADVVHPNLVQLYGLFVDGTLCFFTMEYVEGVTFREHVLGDSVNGAHVATTISDADGRRTATPAGADRHTKDTTPPPATSPAGGTATQPRLPEPALRELFSQLTAGVHAIHEAGKLHRDLKPQNVLVSNDGRVVILDFGLARDLPELRSRSVSAGLYAFPENPELVWGTPEFMSPEQAAGRQVSRATDWYAVGVMLFEALTGQLPFSGDSRAVMTQKRLWQAPDPSSINSDVAADLCRLCNSLLSIDESSRPEYAEIRRVLTPAHPTMAPGVGSLAPGKTYVLLGRDGELDRMQRAFDELRQGKPRLLWVEAASGIGKTALVQEFVTRLKLCADATILAGRCHEREQLPYKAMDAVLDQLARYLRQLPESRLEQVTPPAVHELVRAFPALGTVYPRASSDDAPQQAVDVRESRKQAFGALRLLLTGVAALRPLVIVIDDLQWGDADSALLIEELLSPPHAAPLLLICSFRSDERTLQPVLRDLVEAMPARADVQRDHIVLSPLPESVTLQLVSALLPRGHSDVDAHRIARESAGNPLFLEALLQRESEPLAAGTNAISLDDLIRERAAQLPEPARRLLQVLSVAGQPIDQPSACEAAGLTADRHGAIQALRSGRFAVTRPGADVDRIEPYHDRVRESVYAGLSSDALVEHHAQLARVLEPRGQTEPELLCRLFYGAGVPERAARYAIAAADQAAQAFAFDRAADFYRRALEYHPGTAAQQRQLQVRIGEMLTNAGRGALAAPMFLAAAEGMQGHEALELQRQAAEQWLASGRIDEGMAALRRVVRAVDLTMPETAGRALAELLWLRARVRIRGTSFTPRDERNVPAEQLLRIDSCKAAAWSLGVVDQIQGALFQTKHLLLALDAGEPIRVAGSLATQGMYLAGEGAPRHRADALFAQAEQILSGRDAPHARAVLHSSRGTAATLFGDYAAARDELDRAEQLLREKCRGAAGEINTTRLFWAASLVYLGELRELNERVQTWISDADERGDLYGATTLRLNEVSTWLWLAADDPDTARRDVQEAMAGWPHRGDSVQGFYSRVLPIYIDLYVGDHAAAMRRINALLPGFYRSLLSRLNGLRAPVEWLAGLSHLAMLKQRAGDQARHRRGVLKHLRYLKRDSIPYSGVFAAMLEAGLVAAEEGDTASVPALQRALSRADAARMGIFAACVRDRMGAIVGGDHGATFVHAARATFVAQDVRRPERIVQMVLGSR